MENPIAKRGRGRPPKKSKKGAVKKPTTGNESGRKRGRPPTKVASEDVVESPAKKSKVDSDNESADSTSPSSLGKLGKTAAKMNATPPPTKGGRGTASPATATSASPAVSPVTSSPKAKGKVSASPVVAEEVAANGGPVKGKGRPKKR